ncbi:MAG: type II secretion system protein [Parcubacteria group bacterium]|nr:type II secretion system protein [Parcubacteria group bacterium]
MYKKEKGFTLIELLVVIAIIAILSTVVMAGLNSARLKGRDAKRIADIKQMQAALDLYSDTCGGYPILGSGAYVAVGAGGLDTSTQDGDCLTSGEDFGTFMATLPVNPTPGGADYTYCSMPSGSATTTASCSTAAGDNTSYQLTFTLEGGTGSLSAGDHAATASGVE